MTREHRSPILRAVALVAVAAACQPTEVAESSDPHVSGGTDVERGRYLAVVGGCNDCHTDGYLQAEGNIPEDAWLLGSSLGWRGPWGTTYPANLRLTVETMTEDQWVELLRTRRALPPMPWSNVNHMAEPDTRALYRYIRSLGAGGEATPATVPPDQEPATPYFLLQPVMPG